MFKLGPFTPAGAQHELFAGPASCPPRRISGENHMFNDEKWTALTHRLAAVSQDSYCRFIAPAVNDAAREIKVAACRDALKEVAADYRAPDGEARALDERLCSFRHINFGNGASSSGCAPFTPGAWRPSCRCADASTT